ncbi:hypothetical protein [Thauera sp. SDU_THAU2]|uniref:hypothetical protein n=1 Tax=Thauera sp. SDU_THAU2 TaxID=3136633 RepID=UPI00311E768D
MDKLTQAGLLLRTNQGIQVYMHYGWPYAEDSLSYEALRARSGTDDRNHPRATKRAQKSGGA